MRLQVRADTFSHLKRINRISNARLKPLAQQISPWVWRQTVKILTVKVQVFEAPNNQVNGDPFCGESNLMQSRSRMALLMDISLIDLTN